MKFATLLTVFVSLVGLESIQENWAFANQKESIGSEKLTLLDFDLETKIALAAIPSHLRAKAKVFVLGKNGYRDAKLPGHDGSNGFGCWVARTEWQFGRYDDVQFAPMCFDAEGMKTVWPIHKAIANMRAKGVDPKVMKKNNCRRL